MEFIKECLTLWGKATIGGLIILTGFWIVAFVIGMLFAVGMEIANY